MHKAEDFHFYGASSGAPRGGEAACELAFLYCLINWPLYTRSSCERV